MNWFSWEKLIEKLRGRPKRSPQKIMQNYGRKNFDDESPNQTTVDEFEPDFNQISNPPTQSNVNEPPPVEENFFVLDIQNEAELEIYLVKLKSLYGFEKFYAVPSLNWLRVRMDRVTKELNALNTRRDFDEDFNFELAKKVRNIAATMLDIFRDAKISTQLDEFSRRQLTTLVENYLSEIGLTKKIFHVGDDYTDWANLGMKNSYELISTTDPAKASTIAAIEIQPHELRFRNTENGDIEKFTFGGSCKVYTLKES